MTLVVDFQPHPWEYLYASGSFSCLSIGPEYQYLKKCIMFCTLSFPNHFIQANYVLNGHKLMLHPFFLKAVNYRPVSLTHITCKLFEHKILTDLQNSFRSGRFCETQLVTTFQDIVQMHIKEAVKLTLTF